LTEFRLADGRRILPLMQRSFDRDNNSIADTTIDLTQLGGSYFDEPEPSLAILGPPAVTRLMFELWRTDRRVMARFDLRLPLHRRDYALWLREAGPSLGVDRESIDAALAIVRRGTSLVDAQPPWPSQTRQAMRRFDGNVDAWLAEPIAWNLGAEAAGIPMPRALALLWEQRQDVRLHFPNRTETDVSNYLIWCLTQGILDHCVAVELIAPALADFFDRLDPALDRDNTVDEPPVTWLLRMMAPLYDGPFRSVVREFPATWQARFCLALWLCGACRRRFGWPISFVHRPLSWLLQLAPAVADAYVPLDNLMLGLWELRVDLRARCDLRTHEGRRALFEWFQNAGAAEFEVADCVRSHSAIRRSSGELRAPQRSNISGVAPGVPREVCLVGFASLVSGRAEDLRMTALALGRHHQQWATLDRLSGAIATEHGHAAAAFASPPRLSLLHLNADTAYFDYLFLRERGIEQSYKIGYWAWELAKYPAEWSASFAFVDEVWVASRFAYEAIATATTKPVLFMPMAVAVEPPDRSLKRADFGLPDDKFIFYFCFDFRSYVSRKNPLAAVRAFRRAFPKRSAPVLLVLKTIGSEWKMEERDALLAAIRDDPRIVMIDRELSRARTIALLNLSDCFVSLHRSEGLGRGPAEAMLLGKPVITTDYSGTRDFATRETALLVDYRLVPVGEGEYPGGTGQVWAEADIEQAAAAMRKIAADSDLAQRFGNAGRARIRALYDPQLVGTRFVARMNAIARAM
jgi:glycosyltransferase involved in cell wall biosynthesis